MTRISVVRGSCIERVRSSQNRKDRIGPLENYFEKSEKIWKLLLKIGNQRVAKIRCRSSAQIISLNFERWPEIGERTIDWDKNGAS
jgi:hypothetical protein